MERTHHLEIKYQSLVTVCVTLDRLLRLNKHENICKSHIQGQPVVDFNKWSPHSGFLEPLTNLPLHMYDIKQEITLKTGKSEKSLRVNWRVGHQTALL